MVQNQGPEHINEWAKVMRGCYCCAANLPQKRVDIREMAKHIANTTEYTNA